MIARWVTQNLLEVDTLYGTLETQEDSDQSMTDLKEELAAEPDKMSVETSEEVVIIQGNKENAKFFH